MLLPVSLDKPRILLVHRDPSFAFAMQQCARRWNVRLDLFETIPEKGIVTRYDAAIFVCDFETMPQVEMSSYLERAFPQVPTLLVGGLNRQLSREEARCWRVRSFLRKDHDLESIFFTALGMIPLPPWSGIERLVETAQRT